MQFSTLVALSTLAVSALCAPAAAPEPAPVDIIFPPVGPFPDPTMVFIKDVKYAGSGCPAGTASISFSDNKKNVVLAFDSYIASIGPGIPITQNRKNCNINFKITYPPGFSYTVYETRYKGFIDIQNKVKATQKSDYWFSSGGPSFSLQSVWDGPKTMDYDFTDKFEAAAVVWSPCNSADATLNVNTQVRLDNSMDKTKSGTITTDTIGQKVTQIIGIAWKKC